MKAYEREVAKLAPEEQEETVKLMSSFRREGLHEGKEGLVVYLIKRRFGSVSPDIIKRLDDLSPDELDELGGDLLDFTSVADLESWLARHQSN